MPVRLSISMIFVVVLATMLSARPVRVWNQQELFDESDFVAIVTADHPVSVPNTHEFLTSNKHMDEYLQQHESTLTVHAVLKGDRALKSVALVHFLKRTSIKWGMENGPNYVWMATPTNDEQIKDQERKPNYLVYLRSRADSKFEPVTGQMDPADSVVRLILFPERDPAMDGIEEEPER
jgi:hypothetical protein